MNDEQKEIANQIADKALRMSFDLGYCQGIASSVCSMLDADEVDKQAIKDLLAPIMEIVV